MSNPKICSICGFSYSGMGNNAQPVNDGRCCDWCNLLVTNRRIEDVKRYMLERQLHKAPISGDS